MAGKTRPASRTPDAPGKRRSWLPFVVSLGIGLPVGTAGAAYNILAAKSPTAPVAATAEVPGPAAQAPVDGERTGPMSRKVMLALVRSTLGALGNAMETGNYTTLRDLGAPGFGVANTPERLARIFDAQRKAGVELSGVMITEPVLTIEPRIEATGLMRVAGYFPAGPKRYEFDLLYKPVGGRWRLFGISTGVEPAERVAQAGK